jgi:hypothetical protein
MQPREHSLELGGMANSGAATTRCARLFVGSRVGNSILQAWVGDVRVVAQGAIPLTDAELREHIAEAVRWEQQVRCVLVEVQRGGVLSPRDRVALGNAGLLAKPTAVLVDSLLTRSILTAVSWLGGSMAAFAPQELDEASNHLQIDQAQRPAIARALGALRPRLAKPA